MKKKEIMVFVSHTKRDEYFCNRFDAACARIGIKSFRSELEPIEKQKPAWSEIREAIRNSCAVFLLVGKQLVQLQDSYKPEIRSTQNWIAFEIGVACEGDKDIWVVCDDVSLNFPVPYLNNYFPIGLGYGRNEAFDYLVKILTVYKKRGSFPIPYVVGEEDRQVDYSVVCPWCSAKFNLHLIIRKPGEKIICPQCLNKFPLNSG